MIEHVGLLRIFVNCHVISVKSRNGSFLFIHQFYSLPELFGIVSKIIVPLGPSQLMHDSISFSLIVIEEARISVFPSLPVQAISFSHCPNKVW